MRSPLKIALLNPERKRVVKQHIESIEFTEYLAAAFAEFCYTRPSTQNPAAAWNVACQIEGAREFIHLLENGVSDSVPQSKPKITPLEDTSKLDTTIHTPPKPTAPPKP